MNGHQGRSELSKTLLDGLDVISKVLFRRVISSTPTSDGHNYLHKMCLNMFDADASYKSNIELIMQWMILYRLA